MPKHHPAACALAMLAALASITLAGCGLSSALVEDYARRVAVQETETHDAAMRTHTAVIDAYLAEGATRTALAPPSTDTPSPSASPRPTETPLPSATPITPQGVFASLAPRVAYVRTASGTGSAVLVREGYLLTNAHVVWPYRTARVVFSDGTAYPETPVRAYDLIADLAVVGPLDAPQAPVALADGEALPIGSRVFTIGYPGESEEAPQPTLAQGILSRMREWEATGLTYLQCDAAAIGGQSGGVLLSETGEVIGITGLRFRGEFTLALSASDIGPRVEALLAGHSPEVGLRPLPTGEGSHQHQLTLDAMGAGQAYCLRAQPDKEVEIRVEGAGDAYFVVVQQDGLPVLMEDKTFDGAEAGRIQVVDEAPLVVLVGHESSGLQTYAVTCSHPLIPIDDPDDRATLWLNAPYWGAIDHPYDMDVLRMPVLQGQRIAIHVTSVLIDPEIQVVLDGTIEPLFEIDDDSGGGVFGTDARLVYAPPADGTLLIGISDATLQGAGGYRVVVARE